MRGGGPGTRETDALAPENLVEAIDAIVRERPALVLLDVMMPVKTGFDVCHEVRANEAIRDTLIVMLTAKGRDTDVAKGLALGANAYMTKPFSTKDLVQKVQALLGGSPEAVP